MATEEVERNKSVSFGDSTDMDNGESSELKDASVDKDVEEVTEMLAGLKKKPSKKKSSSATAATNGEGGDDAGFDPTVKKKKKKTKDAANGEEGEEAAGGDDTGFDASMMKKKKKKKATPSVPSESTFDEKLRDAGLLDEEAAAAKEAMVEKTPEEEAEELANGTGPWDQDATSGLTYNLLLNRFFTLLHSQHPDLAGDGKSKSYKIPPPQVLREGNKKTIFANLPDICRKMKRTPEHVIQFLFAELGTNGSVDGNGRLVIKGRFQQKQLENVLRRYILEYLTCRTCRSPDTVLNKENRLFFITCNSCGSKRSVTTIKTGFQATVGKRKKLQG